MNITRSALISLLVSSIACIAAPARAQCVADLVADGRVDGADLGVLLAYWGPTNGSSFSLASDFNEDGSVDGIDLGILLGGWGACAPIVTSISPNFGITNGGTSVRIYGQFLGETQEVRFGGALAVSLTIVSDSQLLVRTPPGASGSVGVTISGSRGATTLSSGFAYQPVITPSWATLVDAMPDPMAVTDPEFRERIVASGLAWRVRDIGTQIEMLLVPAGTFQMGCSGSVQFGCWSEENPVHSVSISQPFYLGRYEVTQGQWAARMGFNPSHFQGVPFANAQSRPVECVSWTMVQEFLALSGMRLPSEAEWEYACRAGTITAFNSGTNSDAAVGDLAWFDGNSFSGNNPGQSFPVGLKQANRLGFHDMHGNVWEWVNDLYLATYYAISPPVDPPGPAEGSGRTLRGGSWGDTTRWLRSSARTTTFPASPSVFNSAIGFRVARSP